MSERVGARSVTGYTRFWLRVIAFSAGLGVVSLVLGYVCR